MTYLKKSNSLFTIVMMIIFYQSSSAQSSKDSCSFWRTRIALDGKLAIEKNYYSDCKIEKSRSPKKIINKAFDKQKFGYYFINNDTIYSENKVLPQFEGGINSMYGFIQSNLIYPKPVNNIVNIIYATLIIDKFGNVTFKGFFGLDSRYILESSKLIDKMPKWIPATKNGHPVNCLYKIKIDYSLQ